MHFFLSFCFISNSVPGCLFHNKSIRSPGMASHRKDDNLLPESMVIQFIGADLCHQISVSIKFHWRIPIWYSIHQNVLKLLKICLQIMVLGDSHIFITPFKKANIFVFWKCKFHGRKPLRCPLLLYSRKHNVSIGSGDGLAKASAWISGDQFSDLSQGCVSWGLWFNTFRPGRCCDFIWGLIYWAFK